MSALDILRSFAESRSGDDEIIRDGITYGAAREALAQIHREPTAVDCGVNVSRDSIRLSVATESGSKRTWLTLSGEPVAVLEAAAMIASSERTKKDHRLVVDALRFRLPPIMTPPECFQEDES